MPLPDHLPSTKEKAQATPSSKPRRRPQAERSADTKRRLFDATVRCLNDYGYAGTSTEVVLKEAGVSRGAMLHHFPTKVDLMVAVVRDAYEEEIVIYADRLGRIKDPVERFFSLPQAAWFALSRPAGLASFEIMNAARSEPGLPERLAPVQARIEAEAVEQVAEYRRQAGLQQVKDGLHLHRLIAAALRGLSVDATLHRNPREITKSIELLARQMRDHYADQLGS